MSTDRKLLAKAYQAGRRAFTENPRTTLTGGIERYRANHPGGDEADVAQAWADGFAYKYAEKRPPYLGRGKDGSWSFFGGEWSPDEVAEFARDRVTLDDGRILRTHAPGECSGSFCAIHHPSNHPLKDAPMRWRDDRGILERVCVHLVGHDDPDDLAHRERVGREHSGDHGCDGCCQREKNPLEYFSEKG